MILKILTLNIVYFTIKIGLTTLKEERVTETIVRPCIDEITSSQ